MLQLLLLGAVDDDRRSNHGEGEELIATVTTMTDDMGIGTFNATGLTIAPGDCITGTATNMTTMNTSEFAECIMSLEGQLDWGDAPDPTYPTLAENNGARHLVGGNFRLGASVDDEMNGQPTAEALGDAGQSHVGVDECHPLPGLGERDREVRGGCRLALARAGARHDEDAGLPAGEEESHVGAQAPVCLGDRILRVGGDVDRTIQCREIVELVTSYLDGALPAAQAEEVEEHLAECPGCVAYLEQVRTTIALTGRLDVDEVPDALMDELLAAFRSARRRG